MSTLDEHRARLRAVVEQSLGESTDQSYASFGQAAVRRWEDANREYKVESWSTSVEGGVLSLRIHAVPRVLDITVSIEVP